MELHKLDYYAALEIEPDADPETVEAAYRFCLETYGEDAVATYGLMSEEERRQAVAFFEEARRVLCNRDLRRSYNRKLVAAGRYSANELQFDESAAFTKVEEEVHGGEAANVTIFPDRSHVPAQARQAEATQAQQAEPTHAPQAERPEPVPDTCVTHKPIPAMEPAVISSRPSASLPFSAQPVPDAATPRPAAVSPDAAKEGSVTPPAPTVRPAMAHGSSTTPPAQAPEFPEEPERLADDEIPELDGRPIGGPELRAVREARGLSVEEVGERTKISNNNIRFLEQSNYAFLPAPVYVRGFLRTYAKLLGIDGDKLVADYMPAYEAARISG